MAIYPLEMLILEGAQAGLSWITVLKKRAAYSDADANALTSIKKTYADKSNLTDEEIGRKIERMVLSALGVDKV